MEMRVGEDGIQEEQAADNTQLLTGLNLDLQ